MLYVWPAKIGPPVKLNTVSDPLSAVGRVAFEGETD
jgi:hypothetical protein